MEEGKEREGEGNREDKLLKASTPIITVLYLPYVCA